MKSEHISVVLSGCAATGARRVLVTSNAMCKALLQGDPSLVVEVADDDIWTVPTDVRYAVVVTSRDCASGTLYARLSSIAAIVLPPHGLVFVLPRDGDPLTGREAIAAFLGVYGGENENRITPDTVWIERKLDHDVIELRRTR